ncbi:unnamed protein product [Onchocerca flexuosa]|uniref:Uncharacterized protein n=1 Tax=Onchocerca flexuosa TaxID=387005 RepID=A0A3P7ZDY0_9BILA|nr:unnamed protein product [Onchocerca flexuosa]
MINFSKKITFDKFFRIYDNQQARNDQEYQQFLHHRQQQIKRKLENLENEEERLRYEKQQYEQKYPMANELQQFSMDDEPDERWKFYQQRL